MCALIAAVGTSIALIAPNRKMVYSMTLIVWLIPMVLKRSLVFVFQPFSEYDFSDLIPIFLSVSVAYVLIIVCTVFWRLRDDEA